MSKIAVILIRGLVGVRTDIKDTLSFLHLKKKHTCVLVDDSPSVHGMLKKVEGYVTYGEASAETIKLLESKMNNGVCHLAPPVGGFERKGIKKSFNVGGALGDRKDAINQLITKMTA